MLHITRYPDETPRDFSLRVGGGQLVEVQILRDHRSYRAGQVVKLNRTDALIAQQLGIVRILP